MKQLAGETVLNIVGNLTADPELRYTQAGVAVANMTIAATPRTFDSETKEWKDGESLFMQATAWKELAEHVAASLNKGSRVIASGRMKQRSYETKEGQKRTVIELELDEIGPSLRYATATVTRIQKGAGGQQAGPGAPTQNKAQDTWAPSAPAAGSDPWAPGGFGDETPF